MKHPVAITDADAQLQQFLHVEEESEAQRLLSTLISDYAGPIIKGIIKRKLFFPYSTYCLSPNEDFEDTYNDVVVHLLQRLQSARDGSESEPILDFSGYVAVAAYNTCHRELRRKFPERWRLKNRIRYLLTHQAGMALWRSSGGETLCGLSLWNLQQRSKCSAADLAPFSEDLRILEKRTHSADRTAHASLREVVGVIFQRIDRPLELDDLVTLVANVQGIEEHRITSNSTEDKLPDELEQLVGDSGSQAGEVEQRQYLQRLWTEIVQLPIRQRIALLLNLRDENQGVLSLLPLLGLVSIRGIAAAMAIPDDRFADLWNLLPLEDSGIATLIGGGVTRQQVINLRKAARARLARRMAASGKKVKGNDSNMREQSTS